MCAKKDGYITVNFSDGASVKEVRDVYQYDHGLKLHIKGIPTSTTLQVQFASENQSQTVTVVPSSQGDIIIADIPDIVLAQDKTVFCYLYVEQQGYGVTIKEILFYLVPRAKPTATIISSQNLDSYDTLVAKVNDLIAKMEAAGIPTT